MSRDHSSPAARRPAARPRGRASQAGNAIEKVCRLLDAVADGGEPDKLAEIATMAEVPKASAHRILRVMVTYGFVNDEGAGRYGPGPRLEALAARVHAVKSNGSVEADLRALQRLTGNTVHLGLRSGDRATYTHKLQSDQPVQMASSVGMQMPLHSTAIGKCILSGLSPGELAGVLRRAGLPARTTRTISREPALRRELESVRAEGFALDDEENEDTIRCLAAPVCDSSGAAIGAVSISTVTFLVEREELLGWRDALRETARSVSAHLA